MTGIAIQMSLWFPVGAGQHRIWCSGGDGWYQQTL
jgi:hypothetical protein